MKSLLCSFHVLFAYICYLVAAGHRHFGNQYGSLQEHRSAVAGFTKAIAHNSAFARAYLERGILYWRELGDPHRAVEDLTTAYQLDPRLTEAIFNRGIAYQHLQDYAAAVADYEAYLGTGDHLHWRAYAQTMIRELTEWTTEPQVAEQ